MIDTLPAEHKWPSRLRIGLLPYAGGGAVWAGCVDAAQKHAVNLVGIAGWWLEAKDDLHAQQARCLYERVSPADVDGLFVWSSGLTAYLGLILPGL